MLAMILEVQISTFGKAGIDRVSEMRLPLVDGVRYLVSLQNPDKETIVVPENLRRSDIEIFEHADRGLSHNRNAAIDHSNADIILIADDDLDYTAENLEMVLKTFEDNPQLDFATFRHEGGDHKVFPHEDFEIGAKLPKGYYLTSFELAFRRRSLPSYIRFSPLLGIGAQRFGCGEENVLLYRLVLEGLRGRFFPKLVATHNGVTTGLREASVKALQGQGAWLWIRYGWIEGFLRLLRDVPRRNSSMYKSFWYMTKGFIMANYYFYRNGAEK